MKKIILVISLLMVSQLSAEQYVVKIDKSNYRNSIQIKCDEGFILNQESNCISEIPTCEFPSVLNESQDACVDPILATGWINTTGDTCNGMRQANFNTNVYFARSKSSAYNLNLTIPLGYHWVTKSEYESLFNASEVSTKNNAIFPYASQCGLPDYPRSTEDVNQTIFLFSGNGTVGMHSGFYESHGLTHFYDVSINFSGYVLYKD
jgi:hypothetical protein